MREKITVIIAADPWNNFIDPYRLEGGTGLEPVGHDGGSVVDPWGDCLR